MKCRVQFADYDTQIQVCVQLHVHSESKLLHHQHLKRWFSLSADLVSRLHQLQRPLPNVKPSLIEELNPTHIFSFMLSKYQECGLNHRCVNTTLRLNNMIAKVQPILDER